MFALTDCEFVIQIESIDVDGVMDVNSVWVRHASPVFYLRWGIYPLVNPIQYLTFVLFYMVNTDRK